MKRKLSVGLALACILFSYTSCQKAFNTIVELDVPHTPLITLNSSNGLSLDSSLVLVKGSKGVSDTGECPILTNANVKLFEDGVEVSPFSYLPQRELFASGFHLYQERKRYKITAEVPGYTSVEAEDIMPSRPSNLTYTIIRNARQLSIDNTPNMWYDKVKIIFDDDPTQRDYYSIRFVTHWPDLLEMSNEAFTYGNTMYSQDPDLEQEESDVGDPQQGTFYQKIFFTDQNFNGKRKELIIYVANGNASPDPIPNVMVHYMALEHLSENAYKYEKTSKLYWWNDGNPFAEPVQVQQNVKNGVGNFRLKYRVLDSLDN